MRAIADRTAVARVGADNIGTTGLPRGQGRRRALRINAVVGGLLLFATTALAAEPPAAPKKPRALPTETEEWNGDLDGMIERRAIRVLVPYSRTLYFNDRGRERGVTVDLFRNFELYINQKFQKQLGKRPITVYIVPTTRDQLLKNVAGGLGDIAAGNLTVTDARREIVDFYVAPDQIGMSELVATGPKSPVINTADDLAGKTVHVRKASSYDKRVQGFKLHPTLYIFGRQAMSA